MLIFVILCVRKTADSGFYLNIFFGGTNMNKTAALLVTIFLGGLGVHRFMAGKIGTGIIWLLTGGACGIGYILDIVNVATGKFTKADGTPWVTEG